MRVLCATTANDGHFGPLLPFARACVAAGHDVRVAAPVSYAAAVKRTGLRHEPFSDAPSDLVGPIMARLPSLAFEEANDVVIREVFARIDAQAALPSLVDIMDRWRPDVVLRESAELASLAAAERAGVSHVHACIGMHEVIPRFAEAIGGALEDLEVAAGLRPGQLSAALAEEVVFSLVPRLLDEASGPTPPAGEGLLRFHDPAPTAPAAPLPQWGDEAAPLIYVTFGSVTGSLPPFAGVFREALDALASVDARILMTVGRKVDAADLRPFPPNAHVVAWWPQEGVLPHAAAMLGHGGFGTTLGALEAGVPQVIAPIFSFDQAVNGEHVAAVGAGLTVATGPRVVERAATHVVELLEVPSYAASARRVADAMRAMPAPAEAVVELVRLAR